VIPWKKVGGSEGFIDAKKMMWKNSSKKRQIITTVIPAQAGIQCGRGTGHRPSPVRQISSSGAVKMSMNIGYAAAK
jgi:hypothetical protein